MIGVLTHHWAKPGSFDEVRALLDRNGLAQSMAAGFSRRQTLLSITDASQITTLVAWDSEEVYEAWRASPARAETMAGAEEL
jgi:heme-degrading monooxygenase HmoA